jgi:hypothetical protein
MSNISHRVCTRDELCEVAKYCQNYDLLCHILNYTELKLKSAWENIYNK